MRDSILNTYVQHRTQASIKFWRSMDTLLKWLESPFGSTLTFVTSITVVCLIAVLSACTSLGVPNLDTFNKKAAAGYTSITTLYDTTRTLTTAKVISANQAQSVWSKIDAAKLALDAAVATYKTSPPQGASELDDALKVIAALQAYLSQWSPPQ